MQNALKWLLCIAIIALATAVCTRSAHSCAVQVAIEQAVIENWKNYKPRKCGLNTFNMANDLVDHRGIPIKDIKIIFIAEPVFPFVTRPEHNGGDWGWHVLLLWQDYIIDMDWNGKEKVMPLPLYFHEMFGSLFESVVVYPDGRERDLQDTKIRIVDTQYFFDRYHEKEDDSPIPPGKFEEDHFINDAPRSVAETLRLDQFVKRHFNRKFLERPDFNQISLWRTYGRCQSVLP